MPRTVPAPLLRYASSRAISSAGRAPPRQGGGHWFEPSIAHLPGPPRTPGVLPFWAPRWSDPEGGGRRRRPEALAATSLASSDAPGDPGKERRADRGAASAAARARKV